MSTKTEKVITTSRLKVPLVVPNGPTFTELSIDVSKLQMRDFHDLEVEYAAIWPTAAPTNGIYMTDQKYQALLVGRINGIIYDQLAKMNGLDAVRLYRAFGSFLGNPEEETPKDEPSSSVVPLESQS